ncbi:MAG: hypothetical protein ACKVQV_16045 [Bacteroidia bacterium]
MNTTIKLDPQKIQIVEFRIVRGHVECPFEFQPSSIEAYQVESDFDMAFNEEKKLVKADLKINIVTLSQGQVFNEAKSDFHISFIYYVENMEELLVVGADLKANVDAGLANAIASITYSTSRGILMTRLQGTALKDFILPVIPPNSLLKKGVVPPQANPNQV